MVSSVLGWMPVCPLQSRVVRALRARMASTPALLFAADALLLGRVTYEGFAAAWPARTDDYANRINSMPKYGAATSLLEATWNATFIAGNVAEEVAKLKEQAGKKILKFGSGELDRTLIATRSRRRVPLLDVPGRGRMRATPARWK
jgi:dihydrofolate reductase